VNQTNYYRFGETGAVMNQAVTVNIGNSANVVAYCVEDNAGNVTRGYYPSDVIGCFSVSNMSAVPTITNYKDTLKTHLAANRFGYGLSEDASNATCFRGILS
jgi:hypothetical protein